MIANIGHLVKDMSVKTNKHIIGVLGGMGPQASCELYRLLIEGARGVYGAKHNDEYPEILIDSIPVPDGFSHPEQMEVVATMLEDRVKRMTAYGATMISLACNTVCIFKERLQAKTPVEVISTVDEVVAAIAQKHKNILLLSSSTSLKLHLYQHAFDKSEIKYLLPTSEDYSEIDTIIAGVLSGVEREVLTKKVLRLTEKLLHTVSVDAIVLGCTEMPLIFPNDFHLPVYSSLSILAESILKRYYCRKDTI